MPKLVHVVPSQRRDIARILEDVREADRQELAAGWSYTPERALEYGLRYSSHVWTGFIDYQAVCMFGVVPRSIMGGEGVPWLVGTNRMVRYQFAFLRRCRPFLAKMQENYQHLENYVDDRNVAAIRWLGWLGFTIYPPRPLGRRGVPFRRFDWRDSNV